MATESPETVKLAEQGVLAGLLYSPADLDVLTDIIQADDFDDTRVSKTYATMVSMWSRGDAISPATVGHELHKQGVLKKLGGTGFFREILDPETLYALDTDILGYAKIVKEASQRRAVNRLADEMKALARLDSGHSASEILETADSKLRQVSEIVVKKDAVQVSEILQGVLDKIEERGGQDTATLGVPSGFIDLDKQTTGWKGGQFIILAARPGQGKTTLALDFMRAATIKAGLTGMFFSLEMGREEIVEKLLAAEARVEAKNIKTGKLSGEEWGEVHQAQNKLHEANLIIDDSAKITPSHIRAMAAKQAASPTGLDLIIIDYIQLISSGQKVESRQQEVSEFSRNLKLLSKELGVPVVALSQLNRGVEQRSDKSPLISDLRESGSLEQDADIIMLLHRPEYYDPDDRPGQAILNLAKHRGGETSAITLVPLLQFSKFANGSGLIPSAAPAAQKDDMGQPLPEGTGYAELEARTQPTQHPGIPPEPTEGDTAW